MWWKNRRERRRQAELRAREVAVENRPLWDGDTVLDAERNVRWADRITRELRQVQAEPPATPAGRPDLEPLREDEQANLIRPYVPAALARWQ